MEQVLLIIGAIVAVWFVVAIVVALGLGRAVRLADDRQRAQTAYRRAVAPARNATMSRPVRATRTPVRAH